MMTREEAIKILKVRKDCNSDHCPSGEVCYKCDEAFDMAIQALKKDPKSGWISVSERLPQNDEDVLVQYEQGGMEVAYYHIDSTYYPTKYEDLNETGWFNENGDMLCFEPIAWMSLPDPYKAEREDKK